MGTFPILHWSILLAVELALIIPLWKLFQRSGRNGALTLVVLIPALGLVLGLALLWYVAFARKLNQVKVG